MANWWDDAPLVEQPKPAAQATGGNWWESAPLVNSERAPVTQDGSITADNASRAFATGVPVIGGLLNRMDAATNATLAPLVDPLLPDSFQKLPGATWQERYDQAMGIQQGKDKAFAEQSPIANTSLNVAGGVAGTVPMIMAAPGLMGAGAGSLGARTLASGASGLGIGTADSAIRSDGDKNSILMGGGAGLVTGLAGPAAGQLVGSGVRRVTDWLARRGAAREVGMTSGALKQLAKYVGADGLDAVGMQKRLAELGPDAMIMDVGPNLQGVAGSLASKPGRAQEILRSAVNDRGAGANQRILSELDQTLGPVRSPVQLNEGIQAGQRATGPAYGQSFADAMPVQTDYIAEALDYQARTLRGPAQKAAQQVRGMLNQVGKETLDTNPYTLFQTRNAIDGMMAGENNPQVMRVLSDARQQIDENLSRNVPGIKMADAQYQELARQNEGLRRGSQILDSGKTSPRPEDLANEVKAGVLPDGLMVGPAGETFRMSQAARAEIDRIVGTKANDIVGLNQVVKGDGDWNRTKLATLFGREKADRIIGILDREKEFANTRHIVDRNSESARRLSTMADLNPEQAGAFGPRQAFEAGGVTGIGRSLAMRGVDKVAQALAGANAEARNLSLAEAISGNRQRVVDALAKVQQPRNLPLSQIDRVTRALLLSGGLNAVR